MPDAHLRFTSEDDEVLKAVVLFCRGQGKVTLAVQEVSKDGKKHIHLLINTSKTISTFGQQLSKAFPAHVGNGSKSVSAFKKTMDDNILYCSKGTKESSPVVLFTTLDENVIEDAHKKYWIEQEKFVTTNAAKPKDKQPNFIQRVVSQIPPVLAREYVACQALYKASDSQLHTLANAKNEIQNICIQCLGQYAKTCDDNIVTRLINGVLLCLVTTYGNKQEQESMCSRIKNRIQHNLF